MTNICHIVPCLALKNDLMTVLEKKFWVLVVLKMLESLLNMSTHRMFTKNIDIFELSVLKEFTNKYLMKMISV